MRNRVGALVGTDDKGDLVLDLLTGSLAPTTYNNYGTGLPECDVSSLFFNDEGITGGYRGRHSSLYNMARSAARAGTVADNSL
jgi:hypothetical protein